MNTFARKPRPPLSDFIVWIWSYEGSRKSRELLLPIGTVGVMGDARTYDSVIAIRAVESQDFMTADWARIPFDVLAQMSNRIIMDAC